MSTLNPALRTRFAVVLAFAVLCLPGIARAATYFVSSAAANDGGSGSQAAPKKYLQSGYALLSPGDTLLVGPGTYANAKDEIVTPPAGTPSAWVTIRAAVDGTVTIPAALDLPAGRNHYLRLEGLKFTGSTTKVINGNYVKVLRTAFNGGPSEGNSVSVVIGTNDATPGASFILLEDCWVYGLGGRYKVLVYNATNIVLRRVVTRTDGGWSDTKGDPQADITVYDSRNVSVQNPIAIDGVPKIQADNYMAAFLNALNETTSTPNANREWRGCLAILPTGWVMATEGLGSVSNQTVTDCASYGGSFGYSQVKGDNVAYRRLTIVNNGDNAFGLFGGSATLADTVVVNSAGAPFDGISPTNSPIYDSLAAAKAAGLMYLPRIESGFALASGGTGGGQRGANVVKRVGTSGSLYAEPGYNTETTENLWPWPYEQRIKGDFAEVSARGFAGSSMSLTNYIWSLLGTASPIPVPVAPKPPTGIVVQ